MKSKEQNNTNTFETNRYNEEFFEDISSIRDWVLWDREIAYVLEFEYDEYMREIRKTKGLEDG